MAAMPWFQRVLQASKKTMVAPRDWGRLFLIAGAIFALFVMIPVLTTPGNDVAFQLSITPANVFVLMVALSLLNGLLITMQWKLRREHKQHRLTAKEGTTVFGMVASAFAATVACAACYSSVLAVFGLGGTIFLVTHRWWFAAAALLLTLFALHHTSRAMTGKCEVCKA